MGLTNKEREHWQDRIFARIKLASDQLVQHCEPDFRERVSERATELARKQLGVGQQFRCLEEKQQKLAELERDFERQKSIIKQECEQLYEKIGDLIQLPHDCFHWTHTLEKEINSKLDDLSLKKQTELMSQSPLGQKLLELEAEQQALIDLLWLAKNSKQVSELWDKLNEALNQVQDFVGKSKVPKAR
ncbi:MAG TPA: hypothetical protein PKD64_15395 [Pirellulaceae bacterium]|nr:hypothetical protein [Pirellulaceae bacterium]HMO93570.1 hypothetical protein [Pirellulaceae bacterium]HMP71583.1 hypothetical protein [Pirellulaceae bacterium]